MGATRQPGRAVLLLAVVATVGLTGSSCGEGADARPTITTDQAAQRVEQLLRETYGQLPPGAELRPHGDLGTLPCDDPTDGGPAGRVFVEQQYEVTSPLDWPADQALPGLAEHWQRQGYRVIDDQRDRSDPRLAVEHPEDGFRVSVNVYHRAPGSLDVYLIGSSPCVWPQGTPDPQ
ncbi:hypothetical protein [Plantactinospora sonchi]|uniref:Uncharacterized protein n=1 Tax=Plantactinospora sonchi TaxID=1544735 RepID=A0ABU7RX12_9ACTN